jgi:Zn/Cd-binding protein ZinT
MEKEKLDLVYTKSFSDNIKEWVVLDKQIKYANEKIAKLREQRSTILANICHYRQTQYKTLTRITISDGELSFYEKKEYSPLTYRYIEEKLSDIIPEQTEVAFIIDYLKKHREIKTVPDIRRIERSDDI